MAIGFDPQAFLDELRKKREHGSTPAKVLETAEPEEKTLAGLATLADRLAHTEFSSGPKAPPVGLKKITLATLAKREREIAEPMPTLAALANSPPAFGEAPAENPLGALKNYAYARHPAKVAKPAKVSLHAQLQLALARKLVDDGRAYSWLLDTTVRSRIPLLDQVPQDVDPHAWRQAITALSDSLTVSGRLISRAYDDQPVIELPRHPPPKQTIRPLAPGETDASRGLDWLERSAMIELGFYEADLRAMSPDQAREIIASNDAASNDQRKGV
jgi:hypothetical protein